MGLVCVCVEILNTTCHVDVVDEEAASILQNTDIGTIMSPCVCVCVTVAMTLALSL